jgi:hypothetical protein
MIFSQINWTFRICFSVYLCIPDRTRCLYQIYERIRGNLYFLYQFFTFQNVLKNEKQLCNGPRFTSTASITMEHIYGFAAILATNYAKPFCPICQQLVSEIRSYFINAELDISVNYV